MTNVDGECICQTLMTLSFSHACLVPDWPAPARVQALCTTRAGGLGSGVFSSLNLGLHVGDQPRTVHANRHHLQSALWPAVYPLTGQGIAGGMDWFFLQQVHGTEVVCLDTLAPLHHAGADLPLHDTVVADAAMTTQPGKVCVVMVADCLPVLFATQDGRAVAAAHAGWRGLAGVGSTADQTASPPGVGVLETTVARLRLGRSTSASGNDIMAWLGPCIGPQAFEVGDDVRACFTQRHPQTSVFFKASTRSGKWLADLAGLARLRLHALGIDRIYGNNSTPQWCTASNPEWFFSHRRDHQILGSTGRMAAVIGLHPENI